MFPFDDNATIPMIGSRSVAWTLEAILVNARFNTLCQVAALAIVLVGSDSWSCGQEKGPVHSFRVIVTTQLEMTSAGKKRKADSDTEFRYNWQSTGSEKTLQFESMALKYGMNGKELVNTFYSRAKYVETIDGERSEVLRENAPENLRKTLQDSFDVPFCKVEVDDFGKELKHTLLAGPGAKGLLEDAAIANAKLFHIPFDAKTTEWDADSECNLGFNGSARGKLACVKQSAVNSLIPVKVSGTLTNDRSTQADSPFMLKKIRFAVSGEPSFDPLLREWVSGKRTMDVSLEAFAAGIPIGGGKGTMIVPFERLPEKK